jgi:hypothetical protein
MPIAFSGFVPWLSPCMTCSGWLNTIPCDTDLGNSKISLSRADEFPSKACMIRFATSDHSLAQAGVRYAPEKRRPQIPWLILPSRRALAIVRQDIGFSLAVKAFFVVLVRFHDPSSASWASPVT